MAEYYAVERSSEYLAHYGIRGMKWGVQKAKERGDAAALSKHHEKAKKKLEKLRKHADRKYQKEEAKTNAALGALGIGAGALGGLASYGIVKGQLAAQRALFPNDKSRLIMHPVGLYGLSGASALGGVGALGVSAANTIRATKSGNKRAVAKYNKFKQEMNRSFAGTKYANGGAPRQGKKRRR